MRPTVFLVIAVAPSTTSSPVAPIRTLYIVFTGEDAAPGTASSVAPRGGPRRRGGDATVDDQRGQPPRRGQSASFDDAEDTGEGGDVKTTDAPPGGGG